MVQNSRSPFSFRADAKLDEPLSENKTGAVMEPNCRAATGPGSTNCSQTQSMNGTYRIADILRVCYGFRNGCTKTVPLFSSALST